MIRPFLERSLIKISGKINITKFKIMEILVILYFGFIGLIDKNLLFISIIILLLLQHFSGFLYIKYDKKERAMLRGVLLVVLLVISTKIKIEIFMFLLMLMCLGSSFFLGTSVANLASFSSITFGLVSSYYMYTSYHTNNINTHYYAILLIVSGSIVDFIDGYLARKFNKNKDEKYKQNGILIDDMADGVTFGYAISAMILFSIFSYANIYTTTSISMIYFICVIYRLYNFTKTKDKVPYGYFEGLPSPAAAVIIAVGSIILPSFWFIILSLFVSISMICFPIKWIHFKMISEDKRILAVAIPSLILLVYGSIIENVYFLYPFFTLSILYAFHPIMDWVKKK